MRPASIQREATTIFGGAALVPADAALPESVIAGDRDAFGTEPA
jgi:hypothetical protein